jgi:hypothetical protein
LTEFGSLQLVGEIDKDVIKNIKNAKNYLSDFKYKEIRTIIQDNIGKKIKFGIPKYCVPKIRHLTLCTPKIRPLTVCGHKIHPLTLCIRKIRPHKRGLYAQDFAKVTEFPRADLSHAYLVEADFEGVQCQGANFRGAQCQGANFRGCEQRICTICWRYFSSSSANSCKT